MFSISLLIFRCVLAFFMISSYSCSSSSSVFPRVRFFFCSFCGNSFCRFSSVPFQGFPIFPGSHLFSFVYCFQFLLTCYLLLFPLSGSSFPLHSLPFLVFVAVPSVLQCRNLCVFFLFFSCFSFMFISILTILR